MLCLFQIKVCKRQDLIPTHPPATPPPPLSIHRIAEGRETEVTRAISFCLPRKRGKSGAQRIWKCKYFRSCCLNSLFHGLQQSALLRSSYSRAFGLVRWLRFQLLATFVPSNGRQDQEPPAARGNEVPTVPVPSRRQEPSSLLESLLPSPGRYPPQVNC